jgi:hypothetical protein
LRNLPIMQLMPLNVRLQGIKTNTEDHRLTV